MSSLGYGCRYTCSCTQSGTGHRVAAQVMLEQRQGHDQRQQALPIVLDEAQQFLLILTGEMILEVTHQVLEDVHMFGPGRFAYNPSHPGPP
jgi:hypothetical protein